MYGKRTEVEKTLINKGLSKSLLHMPVFLEKYTDIEEDTLLTDEQIQQLEKNMASINKLVEEKYVEIFMTSIDCEEGIEGTVVYHIGFSTDPIRGFFPRQTMYVLNKEKRVSKYKNTKAINKTDKGHWFKVHNLIQIRLIEEQIKAHIKELCKKNSLEWQEEGIKFYLFMTREGSPKHLVSREDIKKVLLARKDADNHTLAIDTEGYLNLIPTDTIEAAYYAVRLEEDDYEAFRFSVDNIEDLYLTLLNGWKQHLERERSQWVFVTKNKLVEEKLLMEISRLIDEM